ncbi:MAG: hypothetical protein MZW92_64500 [Comamonadaceae bacterium]|nr:hypothetical protein [Comamonadaceae bacterium]
MNAELVELEDKVGQVLALCQSLRAENRELRDAPCRCSKARSAGFRPRSTCRRRASKSLIGGLPQ